MEKNRMMRLASALLILTLLTTCMISGTFAKYTTKAEGSDTARVAKWGVTVSTHTDLFATSYTGVDDYSGKVTVKASAENQNIVAPGTTGTGLGVTSEGTPEVSYEMKIKLDDNAKMPSLNYTPTGGTATTYEPVKFSVLNGATPLKENLTLAGLTTLFNGTKAIYKYDVANDKYIVDTNLDGNFDDEAAVVDRPNIKIEWEWAFESGEDATTKAFNDKLDTILGELASGTTDLGTLLENIGTVDTANSNINANLTWTVTATQID